MRIKLKNFLTYSDTEFFPGPNMNMVIGPNGTGKSTIVCAIALGMGGKPDVLFLKQVLGRAKDLAQFVKHGTKAATIEIELKSHPEEPIVITRSFGKDKASKYQLNGVSSTEAAIKLVVKERNIQVDNLWYCENYLASFCHKIRLLALHRWI